MNEIASNSPLSPGDDFNQRGDIAGVLTWSGWTQVPNSNGESWRRPGETSGSHASLRNRRFHVFTTNASPLEAGQSYNAFAVFAFLAHNGDFSSAARDLRNRGYGSPR